MTAVLGLTGGVGGAKLALGLQRVLAPGELMVAVNTGDDFEHLGLSISPDVDTMLYTLSGLADEVRGWGRAEETWNFMAALAQLGGECWFRLGDQDLALHIERTRSLAMGQTLSSITTRFAHRLGIPSEIVPMTDDKVRTEVMTDEGMLDFQSYFVARRCEPVMKQLSYPGAAQARIPERVLQALASETLQAIIICPSNPWLSIAPLLAIPAWRAALQAASVPVIAVSPLIGGRAVKGPTAKIMQDLGLEVSVRTIVDFYAGIVDGFMFDRADEQFASQLGVSSHVTDTLMTCSTSKQRLAAEVLDFARSIRGRKA
jgi:LPPG:FO 2-phospho-L-lactate transferase